MNEGTSKFEISFLSEVRKEPDIALDQEIYEEMAMANADIEGLFRSCVKEAKDIEDFKNNLDLTNEAMIYNKIIPVIKYGLVGYMIKCKYCNKWIMMIQNPKNNRWETREWLDNKRNAVIYHSCKEYPNTI